MVPIALAALLGPRISLRPVILVGLVSVAVVVGIVVLTGFSTVVDQMIEPVLMGPQGLVRQGTMMLRK